jgi:hypothetical protein
MDKDCLKSQIVWYHNRLLEDEDVLDGLLFDLAALDSEAASEMTDFITEDYVQKRGER